MIPMKHPARIAIVLTMVPSKTKPPLIKNPLLSGAYPFFYKAFYNFYLFFSINLFFRFPFRAPGGLLKLPAAELRGMRSLFRFNPIILLDTQLALFYNLFILNCGIPLF